MPTAPSPPPPLAGLLHTYRRTPSPLTAFESVAKEESTSIVLFIAGLTEGPGSCAFVPPLAEALAGEGWTLAQVQLTSSYSGWGSGNVVEDAREIGQAVKYFRDAGKGRIVLMGHSTGCQDLITYTHLNPALPKVDGLILQAPVSDREFLTSQNLPPTPPLPPSESPTKAFVPPEITSVFGTTRVTYARWRSLADAPPSPTSEVDPHTSEDFFSSDLTDERLSNVFGKARKSSTKVLGLLMGSDESYPETVREGLGALEARFRKAAGDVWSKESGVIPGPGATHAPQGDAERREMEGRIVRFLQSLT